MDITKIDDPIILKAMAYDEIAKKEQAERNLSVINAQLAKVAAAPRPKLPGDKVPKSPDAEPKTDEPEKPAEPSDK